MIIGHGVIVRSLIHMIPAHDRVTGSSEEPARKRLVGVKAVGGVGLLIDMPRKSV